MNVGPMGGGIPGGAHTKSSINIYEQTEEGLTSVEYKFGIGVRIVDNIEFYLTNKEELLKNGDFTPIEGVKLYGSKKQESLLQLIRKRENIIIKDHYRKGHELIFKDTNNGELLGSEEKIFRVDYKN